MQQIRAVVDGQLQAIPVLTPKHLSMIHRIQVGKSPGYAPDILQDLIDAGLVTEKVEETTHGICPLA